MPLWRRRSLGTAIGARYAAADMDMDAWTLLPLCPVLVRSLLLVRAPCRPQPSTLSISSTSSSPHHLLHLLPYSPNLVPLYPLSSLLLIPQLPYSRFVIILVSDSLFAIFCHLTERDIVWQCFSVLHLASLVQLSICVASSLALNFLSRNFVRPSLLETRGKSRILFFPTHYSRHPTTFL